MAATVLSADWVVPVSGPPIRDGAVAFEDGVLTAVGPAAALGTGTRHDGAVILPGFVNAHTHLEYASYGGFGDGLSFAPWLGVHVRRKARIGPEEMLDVARLGAAECLAAGVTTVADASFSGAAAHACAELGLRAIVHLEVFGGDPDAALARFERLRAEAAPALSERVHLGVSPHAPYSTSGDVYAACASLGLPVATHLAESGAEREWLLEGTGPLAPLERLLVPPPGTTGIRLLAERGLLGPHVVAAHCVTADDDEVALLALHGVAVAHCPRSNAVLGCGTAPVAALRRAGVRVALGTDSPASTPSFDVFDELRAAVLGARARERRPDALAPGEALRMATLDAAGALGLAGSTGSLEPGKQADLAVLSLAGSPWLPVEDPEAAVVFAGSPNRILATLVQGRVRYEKGATEWQELRRRAERARRAMLGP